MLSLDNTRISQFKNCRRSYYYSQRYDTKVHDNNLYFGTLIHKIIANFLNQTSSLDMKELYKSGVANISDPDTLSSFEDMYSKASVIQKAYSAIYEEDLSKYEIVDIEQKLSTILNNTEIYGTPDAAIRDKADLSFILMEHKTASTITASYLDKLPIDTQITMYCYLFKAHYGRMPDKIIYNVIQKSLAKRKTSETWEQFEERLLDVYMNEASSKFYREELIRSIANLSSFEAQLSYIINDIKSLIDSPIDAYYQNTTFCSHYGRCKFLPICLNPDDTNILQLYRRIE